VLVIPSFRADPIVWRVRATVLSARLCFISWPASLYGWEGCGVKLCLFTHPRVGCFVVEWWTPGDWLAYRVLRGRCHRVFDSGRLTCHPFFSSVIHAHFDFVLFSLDVRLYIWRGQVVR